MSEEEKGGRMVIGRYRRIAAAREHGLVMAAREWPYWIERENREWQLLVEETNGEAALKELAIYENEEAARPAGRPRWFTEKIPKTSLFVAGWMLSAFFFIQSLKLPGWEERGVADSEAILQGQWWRTITALTLHGDLAHLVANLATGLLFAMFLIPQLGSGVTWLAVLFTGMLGNAINAWGYRGEPHYSIGASTACFGALGLLMGLEFAARWLDPGSRNRWQLIVPLGAGLGLLAFLGVGDEGKTIDYMAHCWGLIVGLAGGLVAQTIRIKEKLPLIGQRVAAGAAFLIPILAWFWAKA